MAITKIRSSDKSMPSKVEYFALAFKRRIFGIENAMHSHESGPRSSKARRNRLAFSISKKGVFFTLISMVIVVALIAFFKPNTDFLIQASSIPTTRVRINKANHMMQNFKSTLVERELKRSSYFAILQLLDCIDYKDDFLPNLQNSFREVLVNGTLNGQPLTNECGSDLMADKRLLARLEGLSNMTSTQLHLLTNFSVINATLYQSNVTGHELIGVNLELNIKLDAGIARWDSNTSITTNLKVTLFDDPYYLGNANYSKKIVLANDTNWSISRFFDFVDKINYTQEEQAPSFLMRFQNISDASECCGIESMINPYELSVPDLPWSYADYCFYGRNCNGSLAGNKSLWNITGISSSNETEKFYGFKLEVYHLDKYNLTYFVDQKVVCEGTDCT